MMADPGSDRSPERLARAGLGSVIEPGDPMARRLFGGMAATEAWERLRAGGPEVSSWRDLAQVADPERDLDGAAAIGTRFVIPGDDEWPGHLDIVAHAGEVGRYVGPPYGLWVRGDANLRQAMARSVGIVGTRQCSDYGADVTGALASGLVDHEITVVSGGQFGVATAAHKGALSAGGMTVAIRAAGIGVRDLESDNQLLARIADEGMLVSEKPPGYPPTSLRQFARNRLIAASTLGTVVTEAGVESEALGVVEWAQACRRPVLAVPGPVTSPTSAGTHDLIQEGTANLVTDVGDVLDALPRNRNQEMSTILVQRAQRLARERHADHQTERVSWLGQSHLLGTRVRQGSHLTVRGRTQSLDSVGNDPGIEL